MRLKQKPGDELVLLYRQYLHILPAPADWTLTHSPTSHQHQHHLHLNLSVHIIVHLHLNLNTFIPFFLFPAVLSVEGDN